PDLGVARALCDVDAAAAAMLGSPVAPIVLLPRRAGAPPLDGVAPGLATLGVMLPATPLHHLLLREIARPLVATSGNRADEPIAAFERVIADFTRMYDVRPEVVAHDLHPDYASTRWALASGVPALAVQHHHAHLAACLAEHGAPGRALGVTWDGTGLGTDGT